MKKKKTTAKKAKKCKLSFIKLFKENIGLKQKIYQYQIKNFIKFIYKYVN